MASSFAPQVGGVETHVARTARELVSLGHAIEVWTVDQGERAADPSPEFTVRYLPAPLPAMTPHAILRFLAAGPRAWGAWVRAHRGFRPDLLHVHCFGPNGLYGLALSWRFATPLIVTSHGETRGDDSGAFSTSAQLRLGLRRAVRRAGLVTAPSDFVLRDLRESYGLVGGEVIPNGVDIAISTASADPLPSVGGRYLLAVGRLGRMKGFDLLLEAFAAAALDDETTLVIAGDGPERESLERSARRLGIDHRVALIGWLDESQVARAMSKALAVVVPSRSEAFGIVVLEAWRSGSPVIVTGRGGAGEFATDDVDCLIVDPVDLAGFAAALERIEADEGLRERLVAAGSARYPFFSWQRVGRHYSHAYQRVLGSGGVVPD